MSNNSYDNLVEVTWVVEGQTVYVPFAVPNNRDATNWKRSVVEVAAGDIALVKPHDQSARWIEISRLKKWRSNENDTNTKPVSSSGMYNLWGSPRSRD